MAFGTKLENTCKAVKADYVHLKYFVHEKTFYE